MTLTVCLEDSCSEPVAHGRCEQHRKTARRNQARTRRHADDPSMTAYSTPAWRRARARQLQRSPTCVCGAPATVADHHPRTRRRLVALGVPNPDDPIFLQSLCESCHNTKTATVDRAQDSDQGVG